jgi:hypothetical protein
MTEREQLLAHLRERHATGLPTRWTLRELQQWHGTQHHRFWPNHHHAGSNRGAGERPAGWKTGLDVVERAKT